MTDIRPPSAKSHPALLVTALLCLGAVLWLSVVVFRHFLVTLAVAASVAVLLGPLNTRLLSAFRGRRSAAALVLVVLTLLVIMLPLLAGVAMIGNQAVSFLGRLQPSLTREALAEFWSETLPARFPPAAALKDRLRFDQKQVADLVAPVLSHLAGVVTRFFQQGLGLLAQVFFQLILFLFMLFYLLRDGHHLRGALREISPLTQEQEKEVYEHLAGTIKGVWQSTILVPLAQGVLAMIGFAAFGLPSPLFWGVMLAFASLVPGIGTPLVWLPAAVYMIATGATGRGIGLILFGILVISSIDNVLKPIILRGSARIHPMLGFLAIIGGILAFGFVGFLIGPVILSLLLSTVRIYRMSLAAGRAPAAPSEG